MTLECPPHVVKAQKEPHTYHVTFISLVHMTFGLTSHELGPLPLGTNTVESTEEYQAFGELGLSSAGLLDLEPTLNPFN
jgi:hypothetical protein